jgi:hypothetical protein
MTKMKSLFNLKRLSLKESLFIGFCAVFIVLLRSGLRLHLNIPGHSMLFMIFFLMLARACVPYRFSASLTGLIAGIMAMVLGLGRGGPLILLKFLPPAIMIDVGAMLIPTWHNRYFFCLVIAAVAASTKFLNTYFVDYLLGMDPTVNLQKAFIDSVFSILFGMVGSLLVPPIMGKLNAHGIIGRHFGGQPEDHRYREEKT